MLTLLQQRKTEEAETVEDGADEAKKAKPSEETNGAGDDADEKDAETDEQPPVSSSVTVCGQQQCYLQRHRYLAYFLKDGKEQFTKNNQAKSSCGKPVWC